MKRFDILRLSALVGVACLTAGTATGAPAPSPFKVNAGEGRVIPDKRRADAIDLARQLIQFEEPDFSGRIAELNSPFQFKAPDPEPEDDGSAVEPGEDTDTQPEVRPRRLNDRQILALVAPTLRERIRGAIVKGDQAFLSTDNGGRVPLGFTFPARVRVLPGETFQITVSAITTKSFTLKLNTTEITIPIGEQSTGGVTPGS